MDNPPVILPVKLSVLVVSYNHEEFIAAALQSILAQRVNFQYEIVVADDGSKDRTAEIILQFQEKHPDLIKVLNHSTNLGITKNYQRGFAACSGEYIAVLEGDDYWLGDQRLNTLVGFLEEHPECVLVFNRIMLLETAKPSCRPLQWDSAYPYELRSGSDLALENFIGNFSACVYQGAAVRGQDQGVYNLKMYDWLFNLSLSRYGLIGYIPQVLSVYRQHQDGTWASMDLEKKLKETATFIEVYDEFLNRVYSPQFKAHQNELIMQMDILRIRKMQDNYQHNPLITGYIILKKILRRVTRKINILLGR